MSLSHDQKQGNENKTLLKKLRKAKKRVKQIKKQAEKQSKKQARIQTNENKRNKKIQEKLDREKQCIESLHQRLLGWISVENINKLGMISGYIKKSNAKIPSIAFLLTIAFASFGCGSITYNLLALNMFQWFSISITSQALCKRFSKIETVNFLKMVLVEAMQRQLVIGFQSAYAKIFLGFKDVIIEDSTQFQLKENVSKYFKGSGGSSSKASMKLNVALSLIYKNIKNLDIVAGATSDQTLAKSIGNFIKKGELCIRDLGFFDISEMIKINELLAFFISRLKKSVNVYVNYDDEKPIDVYEFLKKKTANNQAIDQIVYIGKEKFKVRLLAEKVPEKVRNQRIHSYKENKIKRNSKKKMDESYFEWFSYSIFITNVPVSMLSTTSIVMTVYKVRWQIEIFFKRIKSVLQIHVIQVESRNRVLCLVYAKLIALLTAQSIVSYAASICGEDEELSEHKIIVWLKDSNRLGELVINGQDQHCLFEDLIMVYYLLCKDKRNRKSTQKLLKETLEKNMSNVNYRDETT